MEKGASFASEKVYWEKSTDGKAFANSEKSGFDKKAKKLSRVWSCLQKENKLEKERTDMSC